MSALLSEGHAGKQSKKERSETMGEVDVSVYPQYKVLVDLTFMGVQIRTTHDGDTSGQIRLTYEELDNLLDYLAKKLPKPQHRPKRAYRIIKKSTNNEKRCKGET